VPSYAPYPLVADPSAFGLVSTRVGNELGSTVARHRPVRGSTRATVFLHGAAGSWTTWTPVLLAARDEGIALHEPVLFDLPGWGDGELADGARTIEAVSELVRTTVLELGYTEWDLVGHSLGGFLALHLAALLPSNVRSVTMVSGTTWSIIEGLLPTFEALLQVMRALSALGGAGRMLVRGLDRVHLLRPAVLPLFRHAFRVPTTVVDALAREVRPASFVAAAGIARGYPADTLWAGIRCPVTALKGDHDVFVRDSDLARLSAVVPQARTMVIPDCGHFANVERPEVVLAAISR
jgi:pimeloyl-ACP methyl ester carboxylesterase